jgi:uncharacterized membrane protein
MYSKAKIGGHPIHPKLVAFPITFYCLTFVGFVVYQLRPDVFWFKLAYFSNFAAIFFALIAAVPGFIDLVFGIPNGTAAKKHGLIHMTLNLMTLGIFSANAYLIWDHWDQPLVGIGTNLLLTAFGAVILMAAAYYGWGMIGYHKVGVDMSKEQERLQEQYEHEDPFVPSHEQKDDPPTVYH